MATRELPKMDGALLRATLPSYSDDDLATNELRPYVAPPCSISVGTPFAPLARMVAPPPEAPAAPTPRAVEHAAGAALGPAADEPFPIQVEVEEEPCPPAPRGMVAPRRVSGGKLGRALSVVASVVGLSAVVLGASLVVSSPEAAPRFPAHVTRVAVWVVRLARSAVDTTVRGVSRIGTKVEVADASS